MGLEHHTNTVSCMCIARSKNHDFLISGSFDRTVAIWDISKRRAFNPLPEFTLTLAEREILAVAYDPMHEIFFTAGNEKVHTHAHTRVHTYTRTHTHAHRTFASGTSGRMRSWAC